MWALEISFRCCTFGFGADNTLRKLAEPFCVFFSCEMPTIWAFVCFECFKIWLHYTIGNVSAVCLLKKKRRFVVFKTQKQLVFIDPLTVYFYCLIFWDKQMHCSKEYSPKLLVLFKQCFTFLSNMLHKLMAHFEPKRPSSQALCIVASSM